MDSYGKLAAAGYEANTGAMLGGTEAKRESEISSELDRLAKTIGDLDSISTQLIQRMSLVMRGEPRTEAQTNRPPEPVRSAPLANVIAERRQNVSDISTRLARAMQAIEL